MRNKFDQRGEFVRFSIQGEVPLPGSTSLTVPDLLVKSYWQNMTVGMKEKITRTKTKGGWAIEHWPADLDTLSVQGATGAFLLVGNPPEQDMVRDDSELPGASPELVPVSPRVNQGAERAEFGLATGNQVFLRRLSEASLNLESLAHFYRTNGASFDTKGIIYQVRDIEMVYLGDIYIGYFTDFNFSHSDSNPNSFTYSFTFRVKETYLTSAIPQGDDFFVRP